MSKLADGDLLSLLPASISDDPQMRAAAEALAPVLKSLSLSLPNLLVYARLGDQNPAAMLPPLARLTQARGGLKSLSLEELELLAWQFHVDFREVARTREQLAAMVRNSIPWHRIKGTPASIRAALALFGYRDVVIEEDGAGEMWATWQLGLSALENMDSVRRIVSICNEMQPARCRLWRMYAGGYDCRPGVWSGPIPPNVWSGFWWSWYSGVPVPGIPGVDDEHELIVSFGKTTGVQCAAYLPDAFLAAVGHEQSHVFRIPYIDRVIWSRSAWSDAVLRNHGFVLGHLLSVHWCEHLYVSDAWGGPWPPRPWAGDIRWDRRLPPWSMFERTWSKSQLMHADHPRDGSWGDINAAWSVPLAVVSGTPPRWGAFAWSEEEPSLRYLRVDEQFQDVRGLSGDLFRPEASMGHAAGVAALRAFHVPRHDRAVWSRTQWSDIFPRSYGFVMRQDLATFAGQAVYAPAMWGGPWPARPWGVFLGCDRPRQEWTMAPQDWSKSSLMYADQSGDGGWGDINAAWSVSLAVVSDTPPRWGAFAWSEEEPSLRYLRVDEQFQDVRGLSGALFRPEADMGTAGMEAVSAGHAVYADRPAWSRSAWSDSFPGNRAFSGGQRMAQLAGEVLYAPGVWGGPWPARPWGVVAGHGRRQSPWGMSITEIQGE